MPGPFQPLPRLLAPPRPSVAAGQPCRVCSALRCSPGKRGASRPRGRAAGGGFSRGSAFVGCGGPRRDIPVVPGLRLAGMGRSRGEGQRRLLSRRDMPRGRMRRDEAAVPRCQNVLSLLCRINQSSVKFRDLFAVWLPCGFFQKC